MSHPDDMSMSTGLDRDDEFAASDYELDDELDDDLDPEGDSEWEDDEEGVEGWDDSSSRHR
jgi:hypothetical protein